MEVIINMPTCGICHYGSTLKNNPTAPKYPAQDPGLSWWLYVAAPHGELKSDEELYELNINRKP
jgi:hypothetical protein